MKNKNQGFTLVELMIVVAIIGILAGIAYPNYVQYVTQSKRDAGLAELNAIIQNMEREYTKTGSYTAITSYSDNDYTYSTTVTNGTTYVATAAVLSTGRQTSDTDCYEMSISNLGVKSVKKSGGATGDTADCWR